MSGRYYVDCLERVPAAQAMDMGVARDLWDTSIAMVTSKEM